MNRQPIINGKVVERSYEDYRNDLYLVNRRYQRKLVWELEEKQAFIDSLANGYPVPLFLFAKSSYKDIERFEIIDGMQRLESIFAFIENRYSTEDGYYFDLSATALTKALLDKGCLEQQNPILSREICVRIVSYELPYSIYEEKKPEIIDEVFRRINSNGKHLSRQEIRQAGVVSDFAQLVRNISTQIRGDVSHDDFLLLSQMKEISIGAAGINPDSVFWVKENILTKEELRQSADEEQVADILGAMLLSPVPPSNVSVLDEYYGYRGTDMAARYLRIGEVLASVSAEKLTEQFFYVYDEIKKVFYQRPNTIIGQMVSVRTYHGPRYFQVLFLSFYDLLIKKEKKIVDYDGIYTFLGGISTRTLNISAGGGWWSQQEKAELISSTASNLDQFFIDRGDGDPMLYSYATELETLLKQSTTENSQYDFKQGIYSLASGERNDELVTKVFKTLAAMANSGKGAVGYVLIGIAEKFEDAEKIRSKYGSDYIRVGNFFVTGVNGEAAAHFENDDAYFLSIKSHLEQMPLPEHYRRQIGSKMRMVNYHGKAVIILKVLCDNGAVVFDNQYFTRIGASNDPKPVSPEAMPAFFAKFM